MLNLRNDHLALRQLLRGPIRFSKYTTWFSVTYFFRRFISASLSSSAAACTVGFARRVPAPREVFVGRVATGDRLPMSLAANASSAAHLYALALWTPRRAGCTPAACGCAVKVSDILVEIASALARVMRAEVELGDEVPVCAPLLRASRRRLRLGEAPQYMHSAMDGSSSSVSPRPARYEGRENLR